VREMRPTLSAGEKTFDTPFDAENTQVRFDCLSPDFADEYGNNNRWANVVRLRDWSYKDQIATVFPSDHRNGAFPKFGAARNKM